MQVFKKNDNSSNCSYIYEIPTMLGCILPTQSPTTSGGSDSNSISDQTCSCINTTYCGVTNSDGTEIQCILTQITLGDKNNILLLPYIDATLSVQLLFDFCKNNQTVHIWLTLDVTATTVVPLASLVYPSV